MDEHRDVSRGSASVAFVRPPRGRRESYGGGWYGMSFLSTSRSFTPDHYADVPPNHVTMGPPALPLSTGMVRPRISIGHDAFVVADSCPAATMVYHSSSDGWPKQTHIYLMPICVCAVTSRLCCTSSEERQQREKKKIPTDAATKKLVEGPRRNSPRGPPTSL